MGTNSVKTPILLGQFLGIIEGVLFWDIPTELRTRLEVIVEEKRKEVDEVIKELEGVYTYGQIKMILDDELKAMTHAKKAILERIKNENSSNK